MIFDLEEKATFVPRLWMMPLSGQGFGAFEGQREDGAHHFFADVQRRAEVRSFHNDGKIVGLTIGDEIDPTIRLA
jgi:hypothetical protein